MASLPSKIIKYVATVSQFDLGVDVNAKAALKLEAEDLVKAAEALEAGLTRLSTALPEAADKIDPLGLKELFRAYQKQLAESDKLEEMNNVLQKRLSDAATYTADKLWRVRCWTGMSDVAVRIEVDTLGDSNNPVKTSVVVSGSYNQPNRYREQAPRFDVTLSKDIVGLGKKRLAFCAKRSLPVDDPHSKSFYGVETCLDLEHLDVSTNEWKIFAQLTVSDITPKDALGWAWAPSVDFVIKSS